MSPRSRFDAIVIGAGHNGLTTAAYLAKAGLATLILERRSVVGGCAVTEEIDPERAPGCRVSTASYIASMLRPEVIRDLELARYGLRMIACDPGVQTALPDGRVISWWSDPARLRRELADHAPEDIDAFFRVDAELRRLARFLQPFFMEAPVDPYAAGVRRIRELLRLFRRFRGMSGAESSALLRFLTGSLGEYLDRQFTSDAVKRLILSNSLYGKHGGPYQPGTAMGLLFHLLSGGEEERQGFAGHVIGGMGAITAAMAASCRDLGVEIRVDSPVASINAHAATAIGVTLADGSVIDAGIVVSNADPKRTFLELVGSGLDEDFRRDVAAIRMDGPCAKVNFVLSEEPRVTGMPGSHDRVQRSLFTLAPSLAEAEDIYNTARRGHLPEHLWVDCVLASNVDPDLATEGRHVLTTFVQFVPYRLRAGNRDVNRDTHRSGEGDAGGWDIHRDAGDRDGDRDTHNGGDGDRDTHDGDWDTHRETLGDRVQTIIGRYAPNVPDSVVARRVLTPLDLERTFGITEGNIFHGDISLEQLFFMRPLPGWANYGTPIRNLYLCGAGTHPGGGVTGAPGYNAARRILRNHR